jgi:hypothetical protein
MSLQLVSQVRAILGIPRLCTETPWVAQTSERHLTRKLVLLNVFLGPCYAMACLSQELKERSSMVDTNLGKDSWGCETSHPADSLLSALEDLGAF